MSCSLIWLLLFVSKLVKSLSNLVYLSTIFHSSLESIYLFFTIKQSEAGIGNEVCIFIQLERKTIFVIFDVVGR